MPKQREVLSEKYGRLTPISPADPIKGRAATLCICECNKEIIVKNKYLKNGDTKSCGCLHKDYTSRQAEQFFKENQKLIGQKIGRLEVIGVAESKDKKAYLLCKCDCGKEKVVAARSLKKETTQSCGCIVAEQARRIGKEQSLKNILYSPEEASARRVFHSNEYRNTGISFEDFYRLSQYNCAYCNSPPIIKYNKFEIKRGDRINYLDNQDKSQGDFTYNGLDRIDSNSNHNIDNVVPCCWICNRAKSNLSLNVFKTCIEKVSTHVLINIDEHIELSLSINTDKLYSKENRSYAQSVKSIFGIGGKLGYSDGNLTLDQFYQLSQLNCYYCDKEPSNSCNRAKYIKHSSTHAKAIGNFIYSGLDRIDSLLPHNYDNVVPSCWFCNKAKYTYSLSDFLSWRSRISSHFPTWKDLSPQELIAKANSLV